MEYKEKYNLPEWLVYIYLHAPSPETDLHVNDRQFMSLSDLNLHSQEHPSYVDISLKYCGMGCVEVFSWHSKQNKIVTRDDGGSNDYDRRDNYDKNKDDYIFANKRKIDLNNWL